MAQTNRSTLTARVPMRIDLAGGTLDVYPLYIFEDGGLTVNAAISVMATASVTPRCDGRVMVRSLDGGTVEEAESIDALPAGGPLELVRRALRFYRPEVGVEVVLDSEAPRGSGLGASSALLMALSACLSRLTGRCATEAEIIDVGANIEAQVIGIPTGKQDYFPPVFGGVCAIHFGLQGWLLEPLDGDGALAAALNERLIVSYTDIPHHSAVTNWAMLRRYIEGEGDAVARLSEIKEIAVAMRACLARGDMDEFPRLLDAEWQLRRGLAEGVTTPTIDRLMAAAQEAGALASKICGAGGGGCMVTAAPPDRLEAVRAALSAAGARVMDARVVTEGLLQRGVVAG